MVIAKRPAPIPTNLGFHLMELVPWTISRFWRLADDHLSPVQIAARQGILDILTRDTAEYDQSFGSGEKGQLWRFDMMALTLEHLSILCDDFFFQSQIMQMTTIQVVPDSEQPRLHGMAHRRGGLKNGRFCIRLVLKSYWEYLDEWRGGTIGTLFEAILHEMVHVWLYCVCSGIDNELCKENSNIYVEGFTGQGHGPAFHALNNAAVDEVRRWDTPLGKTFGIRAIHPRCEREQKTFRAGVDTGCFAADQEYREHQGILQFFKDRPTSEKDGYMMKRRFYIPNMLDAETFLKVEISPKITSSRRKNIDALMARPGSKEARDKAIRKTLKSARSDVLPRRVQKAARQAWVNWDANTPEDLDGHRRQFHRLDAVAQCTQDPECKAEFCCDHSMYRKGDIAGRLTVVSLRLRDEGRTIWDKVEENEEKVDWLSWMF
ncbi:hypothetical protein MKZ38_004469 [Zalerion maritima]|uniref:SprT-like domain-containing protein n=1 Tax=Zalerion maritima TaxID=339359 RepID=A0AAD5RM28_9PEZI|nr:hypothetical protein MKZ38_004469 [Zalerion maritima]